MRLKTEAAGHAQVHDGFQLFIQVQEQVFAPARGAQHLASFGQFGAAVTSRVTVANLDDALPQQKGLEDAPSGLNFGKFGHGRVRVWGFGQGEQPEAHSCGFVLNRLAQILQPFSGKPLLEALGGVAGGQAEGLLELNPCLLGCP